MGCSAHLNLNKGEKLKEQRCSCYHRYEPMYTAGTDADFNRVFRSYNGVKYRLDEKVNRYILIPPTVTP